MIEVSRKELETILHVGKTAVYKYIDKGFSEEESLERMVKNHNLRLWKHRCPKEWRVFHNMKARCTNGKNPRYGRYGRLGVCDEWLDEFGFLHFIYSVGPMPDYSMNGKKVKWSLDRIDNAKGYSPSNCRWATAKQQANNTKNNFRYKQELAASGVSASAFYDRIKRGWDKKTAATTPTNRRSYGV